MVTIFSDNFIIMGVTVILLIAILFKFNLAHVATLASVTALIIMGQHTGSFYVAKILQIRSCYDRCFKFLNSQFNLLTS